ncbi:bifunctional UDP-N-acetylmuramate--L-alanine ligase/D-alanine--D-alanine ligase [Chlamydia psittaci]|uniref:bifunctional UDP-N-acetylmuramate--L-alanine ligase/D-alanine--D-alanine ligase n=1 Tax=Chlamydia psittaci TaxID=83554 RepID=UPI00027E1CBF|nr:bifunctional UDP-N-acetylmuramate--L-alanine ligase/D-alanine--D-alanine ligase [Chlamydia psittaci]AFS21668.1 UDP-N-acetylmuramate--alanine ligase [Chlamydia psittaci MN]KPZ38919.1 D-alanyl-alanine synthetase [Chlamydia psittaci str. Frances]MBE3636432.1 bifunctional UDP-N-acetylmuramate--L-alanine ligase/D-alanine--D-alanine ligase [Chlamydia psittaci]CCO02341.1 putative bifunctional cell division-related protein (includes: UDP-N-acetylmuramate--L-alanine ligase and D-alanine--D-alanine li
MDRKIHYHFIGIGGIGMSALAHILLDRGYSVSGSDLNRGAIIDKLVAKGARYLQGHDKHHIPEDCTIIYGSGIAKDNVEYLEAVRKQLPILHRSELLAFLMQEQTSILVSGSHGKTTVSSLITAIFQTAKKDPSYAIGGLNSLSLNGYSGSSEYFIAEADESDGSLKHYLPKVAVVTNLDNEHLSNFEGSKEKLALTIEEFTRKVEDPRLCFYNGDCQELKGRISGTSYGFSQDCNLRIHSYYQDGWRSLFSLSFLGKDYLDIDLNLIGKHNIANAAVAMGIALTLGIDEESIREALKNFSGIQRRMERKNVSEKFLFFEDYAHHPSEISCTLRGLRDAVGLRRIVAICQPHRFSRLQYCLEDFYKAFQDADEVILTDVYSAGETALDLPSPEKLAETISLSSHVQCSYVPYDNIIPYLQQEIRVHDVCISLGAGNIYTVGNALKDFEPRKLAVGVVCGGKSCEHDISLLSARNVVRYLSPEYYDVQYFIIDRQGLWSKVSTIECEDYEGKGHYVLSSEITEALTHVDFILPILHGPFGEDGTLQGFLEIINKPYAGPSLLFSSVTMDKIMTKRLAASVGVPVVPYQPLTLHAWKRTPELCMHKISEAFTFPMFVKTAHLGSSIGVFEVHNEEELKAKISEAFLYDTDIFIEESRLGSREIEVSCLGDSSSCYYISEPHERCGEKRFISYEEKYGLNGRASTQIQYDLDLSEESKIRVKEFTERVYRVIQGQGSCRVDFFLDDEGNFWLSEMNPIPGMTQASPFLHDFARLGWTFEQIIHQLIISGLHKFDRKKKVGKTLNKQCLLTAKS